MERRSVQEMKTSPLLLTSTGLTVSTKAVLMNQGRPRHSMSNTFEPTMLDMAISAFPDGRKTHVLHKFKSLAASFNFEK